MKLSEAYKFLINELNPLYGERESRSISLLLLESIGYNNIMISLEAQNSLAKNQIEYLNDKLKELKDHKPVQYVLGRAHFYGLSFIVNNNVLIPRPETEELTDLIIRENKLSQAVILDVGTGSGCIAITLALNINRAKVFALDISAKALELAAENALIHKTPVEFIQDDILKPSYNWPLDYFDIIVSNPPYILPQDAEQIERHVKDHEPAHALFTDNSDPLVYYRKIFEFSEKHLKNTGICYCEINEKFGNELEVMGRNYGFYNVEVIKDINNKDRIIKLQKY